MFSSTPSLPSTVHILPVRLPAKSPQPRNRHLLDIRFPIHTAGHQISAFNPA